MHITVLGSGRWASFLAWYCAGLGYDTLLWGREDSAGFAALARTRRNDYVTLPPSVRFAQSLDEALDFGEWILVSISAQALRSLLSTLPGTLSKPVVLCMKGLEADTGCRLSEVARACLPQAPVAVWVGPGHPQDFVRGVPGCMVIDSGDAALTQALADTLSAGSIRFYYGQDLIGTEIGAASKNVIGLAAGMLDGLGLGSLKGVLMARGAREVSRLTHRLGGNELTTYGISHLGDYEATLFSPYSHNRACGECLTRGEAFPRLAEGVATTYSLCTLAERCGEDMPICRAVRSVLDGECAPRDALAELFRRDMKSEFYL